MVPRTPRRPGSVSLADLLTLQLLREEDVLADGRVDDRTRTRAERRYAERRTMMSEPPPSPLPPPPPPPTPRRRLDRPPGSARHARRPPAPPLSATAGDAKCCVCLNDHREYAVVPCFHLCVCQQCAFRLRRCPICRIDIERMQRVFTV